MTPNPPNRPTPEEERLHGWLEETARPIPPAVVDGVLAAIQTTRQLPRQPWRGLLQRHPGLALSAAATIVLVVALSGPLAQLWRPTFPVGAGPSVATGFTGSWQTIDCAQWWQDGRPDCARWGDGSSPQMTIGRGDDPPASYADDAASCPTTSTGSGPFSAVGTGTYERPFLWLTFEQLGCGSFGLDGNGRLQLYHDPGSDTLWEDEDGDGWGLTWRRVR